MDTILFYLGVFFAILFFSFIAKLAMMGISETVKNIQSKIKFLQL